MNKQNENYNGFIFFLTQEMGMYSELSQKQPIKKDRELNKCKYDLLCEVIINFKNIYRS